MAVATADWAVTIRFKRERSDFLGQKFFTKRGILAFFFLLSSLYFTLYGSFT